MSVSSTSTVKPRSRFLACLSNHAVTVSVPNDISAPLTWLDLTDITSNSLVKLNPPPKPEVNLTTVVWFPQVTRHMRISKYSGQLQLRKLDEPWMVCIQSASMFLISNLYFAQWYIYRKPICWKIYSDPQIKWNKPLFSSFRIPLFSKSASRKVPAAAYGCLTTWSKVKRTRHAFGCNPWMTAVRPGATGAPPSRGWQQLE